MLTYVIIPARGGSKGIPRKNLSVLDGRSLIEIGVKTCIGAKIVDKVFVSTDDPDIKKEALKAGALGCKVTGSGNGGCMIAYAPGVEEEVSLAIERVGGRSHIAKIVPGVSRID